jgi:hypothetical protein
MQGYRYWGLSAPLLSLRSKRCITYHSRCLALCCQPRHTDARLRIARALFIEESAGW